MSAPANIAEFEQLELHIEKIVEEKVTNKLNRLILTVIIAGLGSIAASVGTVMWVGFEWGQLKTTILKHDRADDQHLSVYVTRAEWILTQTATVDQLRDIKDSLKEISSRLNGKVVQSDTPSK